MQSLLRSHATARPSLAATRSPRRAGTQRSADKLENKTDKRVYFRGDVRANYGKVMDAIDGIRGAGVSQLGMIAEKPLI